VVLNNLIVKNGVAQGFLAHGGGILIRNANVTMIGGTVTNNNVDVDATTGLRDDGGGIAVIGTYSAPPAATTVASLTPSGTVIKSNIARNGAGVLCVLCTLSLDQTLLNVNIADEDGGGIEMLGDASSSAAISSLSVSNIAPGRRGGR